ncbi:hypothetical protein KQH60_09625 [Mycetohabitans sp. B8]|uniref:hypothetical protein n=1 Tax=Mycetohabitans sp. B8 TaxID=2841845 RepID=UPI001F2F5C4B|nr:hypothetical protein [Mycetohabitans sp. B8]MCG1042782.1 hypothetical protein [Mycetohabitans sp. B8]
MFVIQGGAADWLNIVVQYAGLGYSRLRGALAIDPFLATRLHGTSILGPSLVEIDWMSTARTVLFLHVAASLYRDKSHLDGHNLLQAGGT